MNEYDLSDAVTENCCRGTVQKVSFQMALSVNQEMTRSCHAVTDSIFHAIWYDFFNHFRHPLELLFLEDNLSLFFNMVTITILLLLIITIIIIAGLAMSGSFVYTFMIDDVPDQ